VTQEEKLNPEHPLPAWAEEAARLEAREGLTLRKISERVGKNVGTVSLYRNHHPKYLELRTEEARLQLGPHEEQLSLARQEGLSGVRAAIRMLTDQLTLEIDGQPQTGHQQEAARILLNSPITKQLFGTLEETEGKTRAQAVAAVQVVIPEGEEKRVLFELQEKSGG
jgi:hypothetical protein